MSERLNEGRKSNILKVLSQLHAYLKRYQDLDKTEVRFEQRLEDAGCTDMYAVIDDVLDIVETGKKADKARMLNRVYKAYFPKSAAKEPASDEEVEAAIGDENDVGDDEAGEGSMPVEGSPETMTLGDLRKGNTSPSKEPTLGDVRKDDEEYLSSSESEDFYDDEGDSDNGDDLQSDLDRSRGKLDDEELEEARRPRAKNRQMKHAAKKLCSCGCDPETCSCPPDCECGCNKADLKEAGYYPPSYPKMEFGLGPGIEDDFDRVERYHDIDADIKSDFPTKDIDVPSSLHEGIDEYDSSKDVDVPDDDYDDEPRYTINDLEPGMIVNCGAYGDGIIVCSIHDEHRFWGTDDKEEYQENGRDASGWYFDVADVEDIVGFASQDGENDIDADEGPQERDYDDIEHDEQRQLYSDKDDDFYERTIRISKAKAKSLYEAYVEPDGSTMPLDDSEDQIDDRDFEDEDTDFDEEDLGDVDLPDIEIPRQALAGTRHQPDMSGSMTDEAHEFIADMKNIDPEISNDELIDAIVEEFSDSDHPMERNMAMDILDEYDADNDAGNEEATEGDIENAAEDLIAEGYPTSEILDKLARRFKLTRHEVEMIVGDLEGDEFDDESSSEVDEYPDSDDEEDEHRLPFPVNESVDDNDNLGEMDEFEEPTIISQVLDYWRSAREHIGPTETLQCLVRKFNLPVEEIAEILKADRVDVSSFIPLTESADDDLGDLDSFKEPTVGLGRGVRGIIKAFRAFDRSGLDAQEILRRMDADYHVSPQMLLDALQQGTAPGARFERENWLKQAAMHLEKMIATGQVPLLESADDDLGDTSDFESPVGKPEPFTRKMKGPSRATYPKAMEKVYAVLHALGMDGKRPFIDGQTSGYRVKLGTWYEGPDGKTVHMSKADVDDLQNQLDHAGYPEVKAKLVGSQYSPRWLAFIVPYGLNESLLPPNFAATAKLVYDKLAMGMSVDSIMYNLRDKGITPSQIDQIFQYIAHRKPTGPGMREMVGPTDQGGTQAAPPAPKPATPYDTGSADLGGDIPPSTDPIQTPGAPQQPDQTQQLLQNPEFADFFDAMSKINPNDLQNLTQALGQNSNG